MRSIFIGLCTLIQMLRYSSALYCINCHCNNPITLHNMSMAYDPISNQGSIKCRAVTTVCYTVFRGLSGKVVRGCGKCNQVDKWLGPEAKADNDDSCTECSTNNCNKVPLVKPVHKCYECRPCNVDDKSQVQNCGSFYDGCNVYELTNKEIGSSCGNCEQLFKISDKPIEACVQCRGELCNGEKEMVVEVHKKAESHKSRSKSGVARLWRRRAFVPFAAVVAFFVGYQLICGGLGVF